MTTPNETDKLAPSATITEELTNHIRVFQAIIACDTNIAFAKRNLFSCFNITSLSEFCPCLGLC